MRVSKQSLHHPSRIAVLPAFKLPDWQRRSFYGIAVLLWISGALWLVAHFFLRPVGEFGATIHPAEPWSMKVHGAAAMLILWLTGSLLQQHIKRALLARRNLAAGWSMIVLLGLLAFTGYGLYYIAGEESRPLWSAVHWVVGLGLPVMIALHVHYGRKSTQG